MSSALTKEPPVTGPTPEELKLGRRHSRRAGLFEPELLEDCLSALARHASPRHPVEEPGDVRGRGRNGADHHLHDCQTLRLPERGGPVGYLLALDFWLVATLLFANFASAIAEARGKAQADALRKTRRTDPGPPPPRPTAAWKQTVSTELRARRSGRDRGRRSDSQRRRDRRGGGLDRRIGHYRRVGPGDPRGRRRPLGCHRRNPRALRPHRGRRSRPAPATPSWTA